MIDVLNLSVLSTGMVIETNTSYYQKAQGLVKFIAQPNPYLRAAALSAILNLVTFFKIA